MLQVMILDKTDSLEDLQSLVLEWETAGGGFGVNIETGQVLKTIGMMITMPNAEVLALCENDRIRGFMGVMIQPNHVGAGLMAFECLFFVSPSYRRYARKLITAAEQLARSRRCTHFVLTASRLANENSDRVGRFFQVCGFVPYEATFIKEV